MKHPCLAVSILVATTFAAPAHAARCFSMYDAKNRLVMQSSNTPIDLSRSVEDQMRARFPSRYLVISDNGPCPDLADVAITTPTASAALLPSRSDGTGESSVSSRSR